VTAPANGPLPTFEAANVQPSPPTRYAFSGGGQLRGDRYYFRQATMAQLIASAYGVDARNVQGGPWWMEWDHFDIVANAPPSAKPADLQLMLRSLLLDRFHLVVHDGTAPMAAMTLLADHPKLKPSTETPAESGDPGHEGDSGQAGLPGGCMPEPPPANGPRGGSTMTVDCHHATMQQFAESLRWMGSGYFTDPVNDATGLKGTYDFTLQWTPTWLRRRPGGDTGGETISIFDAVQHQLGLRLERRTAPRAVLIVDSATEAPTPNAADIDKVIPPAPPAQFEVAVVKPAPSGGQPNFDIRGDQFNVSGMPLKFFIDFAWDLNFNDTELLANVPPWLNDARYDIVAKIGSGDAGNTAHPGPQMDIDQLREMVRALIVDRFEFKTHTEQRAVDAYVLLADGPTPHKADPASRTKCTEGPGPDGKDPRIANPVLDRLIYCQNVTMQQFVQQLSTLAAGYFQFPVEDQTGLKGSWDFTLSFSSSRQSFFGMGPAPAPAAPAAGEAAEPTGELPLPDAIHKQLGLRLEKQKRPEPVMVIDHIDQQPTAN
jgi:uncharacterized protein (TIGR03435 family)